MPRPWQNARMASSLISTFRVFMRLSHTLPKYCTARVIIRRFGTYEGINSRIAPLLSTIGVGVVLEVMCVPYRECLGRKNQPATSGVLEVHLMYVVSAVGVNTPPTTSRIHSPQIISLSQSRS